MPIIKFENHYLFSAISFFQKFFVCFHSILWRCGKEAFLADTYLNLTRYGISRLICVVQPFWWWWQHHVAISYRNATKLALLSQRGVLTCASSFVLKVQFFHAFFFPWETSWNECACTLASVTCLRQWCLRYSCAWGCQTRIRSPLSGVKARVSADSA